MMRSLFAAVSSLRGHQTRMDVIGNNIANVNTIGFKSSRTTFADTLSQTTSAAASPVEGSLGGTNPKQIGLGANVASIDLLFSDGSPQTTGNNTDLALSGEGLFIMVSNNGTYYTRDGSFSFDADGNLVLPGSGLYVQGWMADDNGDLYTSAATGNITVPSNKSMEATQTSTVTYSGNLNASVAGYEISSISVYYADGTNSTTSSYVPTAVPAGTVTLKLSSGETVTLDNSSGTETTTGTAGSEFVQGQNVVGQILYTSQIAAVTASNQDVGLDLSVTEGTGIWAIGTTQQDVADTATNSSLTRTGLSTGTFIPGGTTALTGTVAAVQTVTYNGQRLVQLQLTGAQIGGNAYSDTAYVYVGNNDYKAGDAFSENLNIDAIRANTDAHVTLADGANTTVNADNCDTGQTYATFTSTSDTFVRYGNSSDGSISEIDRTAYTTYTFGGATVDSVKVNTTSGASLDGLVAETYTAGSTSEFYPSTTTMFTVYDSLGAGHTVPVLLTKTDANEWNVALAGGADSYTTKEDDGSTTTVSLTKEDLKFTTSGAYSSGSATLSMSFGNGAEDMNVAIELSALTQYSGTSSVNAAANGNAAGSINSVTIDTSGIIIGSYSNGLRRNEAQIAIATFTNSAGLTKTSNSLYQESNNSGTPTTSTMIDAGTTVTSAALEMSNVDIANEFSDMIVTQRGFQSNSKMITVADEMLETLINMKR